MSILMRFQKGADREAGGSRSPKSRQSCVRVDVAGGRRDREDVPPETDPALMQRVMSLESSMQSIVNVLERTIKSKRLGVLAPSSPRPGQQCVAQSTMESCGVCGVPKAPSCTKSRNLATECEPLTLAEKRALALRRRRLPCSVLTNGGWSWDRAAEEADEIDQQEQTTSKEKEERESAWSAYLDHTEPRRGRFRWPLDVPSIARELQHASALKV